MATPRRASHARRIRGSVHIEDGQRGGRTRFHQALRRFRGEVQGFLRYFAERFDSIGPDRCQTKRPNGKGGFTKRLVQAQQDVSNFRSGENPRAKRLLVHLFVEARIKMHCHSIAKSWQLYAAGFQGWVFFLCILIAKIPSISRRSRTFIRCIVFLENRDLDILDPARRRAGVSFLFGMHLGEAWPPFSSQPAMVEAPSCLQAG